MKARLVSKNPSLSVIRDFVIPYNRETDSLREHGLKTQYSIYPTANIIEVCEYMRFC